MKRIRRNVVLIMLLCTVLSVTLVGTLSITTSRRIVNENSIQHLDLLCEDNQLRINAVIDSIEQSVDGLAENALGMMGDGSGFQTDPDYASAFSSSMRGLLLTAGENTYGSMSVYLRFNPDLTSPTAGLFLVREDPDSEFEERAPTDLSKYSPDDTEHVGWYYIPVENDAATWMPPYENENINAYMISYVVPLYKSGVCYGVVGMDIDFKLLRAMVDDISIYDTGYAFVMDRQQNLIIHPTLGVYTPLSSVADGELTSVFTLDKVGASNLRYVYNGVPMSAVMAELGNGMILVLAAPVHEIFKDSNSLSLHILLVALGSFAGVTLIALFVITRMLRPATTDALTGINNRAAFLARVKQRLSSNKGIRYAFIMLDIDHFKQINDTLGHAAGDEAIRQVAADLNRVLPGEDLVGRYGGDEFLAFLQCGDRSIAERRLSQLRELLAAGGSLFSGSLTFSAGVVFSGDYSLTTEQLLAQSDAALYAAKQQGRDRSVFSGDPEPAK